MTNGKNRVLLCVLTTGRSIVVLTSRSSVVQGLIGKRRGIQLQAHRYAAVQVNTQPRSKKWVDLRDLSRQGREQVELDYAQATQIHGARPHYTRLSYSDRACAGESAMPRQVVGVDAPARWSGPVCCPRRTRRTSTLRPCSCPYCGKSCRPSRRMDEQGNRVDAIGGRTFSGVSSSGGSLTISPVILYIDWTI